MKGIFLTVLSFLALSVYSQESRLDDKIDEITYDWDIEATKLSTYKGLRYLCLNDTYRERILDLLDKIHHYDTILYGVLKKLSKTTRNREVKKTLEDIKKFESEYDTKSFVNFMNQECVAQKEIEIESEKTVNDLGINSYSGQVYILETELFKYVKHVTARVDKIRLHVHHLSFYYGN